jgi:hypothetical protein
MSYIPVAYQVFTPASGDTIVVAPSEAGIIHVIIEPTATLATLTITMPSPIQNQKVIVSTTQLLTLISVTGTVIPLTSLAANSAKGFSWVVSKNKWYQVQG